jgi:RNase P subunit RPR2
MTVENQENAIRVVSTNLHAAGMSLADIQDLVEGILDTSSKTVNQWACGLVEESLPTGQKVRSIYSNTEITCRDCGHDHFVPKGRNLDNFFWACAKCGAETRTLTETGASA